MKTLRKEPIRLVRCEEFPAPEQMEEHVVLRSFQRIFTTSLSLWM